MGRKPRQRASLVLLLTGSATTAVSSATFVCRYYNGGTQALVVLGSLVPMAVVSSALGAATLALAGSRAGTALALVCLSLIVSTEIAPFRTMPTTAASTPFTVFTANMRLGAADAESIVATASRTRADAVALEELTPQAVARLKAAGLDNAYRYSQLAPGPQAAGVGLWSDRPISTPRRYGGLVFNAVSVSVLVGGTPSKSLTIFATHMVAPWPGSTAVWQHDLQALGAILRSTRGPMVDAGDFNATLDHPQFRRLLSVANVKDSAQLAGDARIATFPADSALPPIIGIDHVLSRQAPAVSVMTVRLPGSDHLGLVARLAVSSSA
jgi:endonuclease/exonuclease/phosphatase (EEP) superfamily protein YafD